jgi:hypothetical protein
MSDNEERSYVKGPRLTEEQMQRKLEDIRTDVSKRLNKWADKIQVGFTNSSKIERVEGETWKENGKTYIMKNGIKQSQSAYVDARMPWHCPKCSKSMSHRFDRKFYYLRGWCFNCNVDWEGQMRVNGTWDAFERRMMMENRKSQLRDMIVERTEYMRNFKEPQIHFQDGRWEKLATIDEFRGLFDQLEAEIAQCVGGTGNNS